MFKYKAVILDIEGTTTPISFVHDVLFPYVSNNLESFLAKHYNDEECQKHVKELIRQADEDRNSLDEKLKLAPKIVDTASCVENIKWQMSWDRKGAALKGLQGYMWKEAFVSGEVKGQVYPDVVAAMQTWKKQGISINIYSSGSIDAQKLVFGYSDQGDLLSFIQDHFDTTKPGGKLIPSSYTSIAKELQLEPSEILFVSDNPLELEAASSVGMQVLMAVRPGNAPTEANFTKITDFHQILNNSAFN